MQKDDNHDAGPSALRDSPSDSDHDASPGAFPPSAKLRDKVNKLANWRIDLSSIEFVKDAPESHGGFATVSRALLASPSSFQHRTSQSDPVQKDTLDSPGPAGEAFPQRRDVAVKKMHVPDGPADGPARILGLALREAEFLVGLSHENVIKLEGFVEDLSKDVVWLVFPWAENGNLRNFIASAEWEIPERVWLINDVARGVEYLHSRQPPIRHGDLKSINILVNSEYRAVITDFGSARYQKTEDLDEEISRAENKPPPAVSLEPAFSGATNTMTLTLKGDHFTLRWAAPELLYKRKATLASDIWALGCVVYEVMTNTIPFHDVDVSNVVAIRIVTGNLPSITNDDRMTLIKALCSLALACWSEDPRKRPTAEDCRKSINWMPTIRPDPIRTADATVSRAHQPELLMQLGWMHVQQGDYTKALGFFNDATSSYEDVGDSERKAAALHQAAQVLRLRNEYSQAVTFYSEALQIFTDVGNMQGIASALLGLAEMHRFRTEYSQAVTLYSDALQTYTDIGDRLGRVTALLGLAEVHQCRMEYSQAITFYSEVIKASADIGNRHAKAKALQGLAAVHLARKEYSQALPFLSEALQIRTDIGDNYGRAATLQSLARVHEFQKEYSQAVALFSEALEICTDIGDQYGRAHSLAGLGDLCCDQGNYGDAIGPYTEAAEVFGQVGDAQNAAVASNQVAKIRQLSMRGEAM